MPYALRNRTGSAVTKDAVATSPVSKKNLNTVIKQIKDLGDNGLKALKKTSTGGVQKRAHPQVKKNTAQAHKRVIKQIQQTLSSSKPSETKQRQTIAKNRESVTAQIAKRAVLDQVKKLGTGNPIKRVAKVHVKRGVDLHAVSGGKVRNARATTVAKRSTTRSRTTKSAPEKLQKAVQLEIKRIAAKTPSEAKIKAEVAQKFSAVKTELKKRAVLQEIKKVGSSRLRKTNQATSKK
ncbi:hypothetical protein BC829DRAFT_445168 [Chytridium lagenaria]|nr:hypothetical protein BC829DRAFT_445168 [Chytridium lagenaria]